MDRKDLQALSKIRLREAKALLRAGLYDGAYYLAGYAVECALKACIAKATRRHEFPDKSRVEASYTHKLASLVRLANLEEVRLERVKNDDVFRKYWDVVAAWTEESRYQTWSSENAWKLYQAASDRYHGVIGWIKPHW